MSVAGNLALRLGAFPLAGMVLAVLGAQLAPGWQAGARETPIAPLPMLRSAVPAQHPVRRTETGFRRAVIFAPETRGS